MEKENINKIIKNLRRYSFETKINVIFNSSKKYIDLMKIDITKNIGKEPPTFNLEILAMFAIGVKEWKDDDFTRKDLIKLSDLLDKNIPFKTGEHVIRNFLLYINGTQLRIQRNIIIEIYRYNFYFTFKNENIDVNKKFKEKFNCDYKDFISIGYGAYFLILLINNSETKFKHNNIDYRNQIKDFLAHLYKKYSYASNCLTCTREEYIEIFDKMKLESIDYYGCSKPSYAYPFIKFNNDIYLPLPHILFLSITEFLMSKFTLNDNNLRSILGKEAAEEYLFDILFESKYFDKIEREKTYGKGKAKKTSDVLCKKGNNIIFFDSKLAVPSLNISIADDIAIKKNLDMMISGCKQLYKQIIFEYPSKYEIFMEEKKTEKTNIWGILVVGYDSLLDRREVYESLAEHLGISLYSDEYNWLCGHIIIVDIGTIEHYFFFDNNNFLEVLKRHCEHDCFYNFLGNEDNRHKNLINENFINFKKVFLDPIISDCRKFFEKKE